MIDNSSGSRKLDKMKEEVHDMQDGINILIVDDNKVLTQNLCDIFNEHGYSIEIASDGQMAIELGRRKKFDLTLIDMKLPDINGLKLIETLYEMVPDMEYIIITAFASFESVVEAVKHRQVVAYETKPLDMERLLALIRQVIDRKLAERAKKQAVEDLRESEIRFRNLFEQSNDAIFLHNLNGDIMKVNNRACEMVGMEREKLTHLNINELRKEKSVPHVEKAIETTKSKGNVRLESKFFRSDSAIIDVEISSGIVDESKGIVQDIVRDITERKRAERKIKESLNEKEVLLKEIHHRVKNNLQIVCALLNLQTEHVKNEQTLSILNECENRVRSMAIIHESLYQSDDFAKIDLNDYLWGLASTLFSVYCVDPDQIEFRIENAEVFLGLDQAVSCGLILNELITNAIKYAFPDGRKGRIDVALHSDSKGFIVSVKDNGIGLPKQVDIRNPKTLGLRLVSSVVEQLEGALEVREKNGTMFKFTFRRNLKLDVGDDE